MKALILITSLLLIGCQSEQPRYTTKPRYVRSDGTPVTKITVRREKSRREGNEDLYRCYAICQQPEVIKEYIELIGYNYSDSYTVYVCESDCDSVRRDAQIKRLEAQQERIEAQRERLRDKGYL